MNGFGYGGDGDGGNSKDGVGIWGLRDLRIGEFEINLVWFVRKREGKG